MMKEREIEIKNLPDKDHFIIVNPEEIGMYKKAFEPLFIFTFIMPNAGIHGWNIMYSLTSAQSFRRSFRFRNQIILFTSN